MPSHNRGSLLRHFDGVFDKHHGGGEQLDDGLMDPEPVRPRRAAPCLTEVQQLKKTLDMVDVVGEEYQGQYDSERRRYRELTGDDCQPGFSTH